MSFGITETNKLKENLELQLNRLKEQLQDLEDNRSDIDSAEYEETKQDTIDQLNELNSSLTKLMKGDISLTSSLEAVQKATQDAIAQAFNAPGMNRFFNGTDPKVLRDKLTVLESDFKIGKLGSDEFYKTKEKIYNTLRENGERLSHEELQFLNKRQFGAENRTVDLIPVNDEDS